MDEAVWKELADRLCVLLDNAVRGDTVILSKGGSGIQFAHVGSRLHFESVSDAADPADGHMPASDEERLVAFGWQPPDPPNHFSHTYDIPAGASIIEIRQAVDVVVRTLADVHGIAGPTLLTVEAWNDESGRKLPFAVPSKAESTG